MKTIKTLLNQKQISAHQLSRLTNIPESMLHAMVNEQIKRPSFESIVTISRALNVPLESFIEGEK